ADTLFDAENPEAIRDDLYARDREINHRERKIRRRIISHLAANPSDHEIPTAFILTSLVKDAERIGDYVKNLYEVHQIHGGKDLCREAYDRHFDGVRTLAKELFIETRGCFSDSDTDRARRVIETGREAMRRCDEALPVIASGDHEVPEAVSLVLTARYYKRILAHLVNIATAVVMPADKVDYFDEPLAGD
ncbi:MAG: PhoU domain-containing protein, partial [Gemmatimonadota bacterium]|nr:PhoU domain-containing protein [Gemmatimonadota bacterium]